MIYDRLTSLAACLCEQIKTDGLPDVCFCGVIPGDAVVASYAGECSSGACGMAWVRLLSIYPAARVGEIDESVGNCAAASSLGHDVEIGILRCTPVGDASGESPTAAELGEATKLQADDAMAIWRTLYCCTAINNKDVRMGTYTPMGPLGGMVGGSYQAMLVP